MAKKADTNGNVNLNQFNPESVVQGNDGNSGVNDGQNADETNTGGGVAKVFGCVDQRAENWDVDANSNDGSCRYKVEKRDNSINHNVTLSFKSNIRGASIFQDNSKINNVSTPGEILYTAKELQTPRTFTVSKTGTKSDDEYKVQAIKRDLIKTSTRNIDAGDIESTLPSELVEGIVGQQDVQVSFLYFDIVVYKKINGSFQEQRTISPRRNDEIVEKNRDITIPLTFELKEDPPPKPVYGNLVFNTRFPRTDFPIFYKLPNGTEERVPLSEGGPRTVKYKFTQDELNAINSGFELSRLGSRASIFLEDNRFLEEFQITRFRITDTDGSSRNIDTQSFANGGTVFIPLLPNKNATVELVVEEIPSPPPSINIEFRNDIELGDILTYNLPDRGLQDLKDGQDNITYELQSGRGNVLSLNSKRPIPSEYTVEYIITKRNGKQEKYDKTGIQYGLSNEDITIETTLKKRPQPPTTKAPETITIRLDADVADENFLEYSLSDGTKGRIRNGINNIGYTLLSDRANILTIRPIKPTDDFNIAYNIEAEGGGSSKKTGDFFTQVELGSGDVRGEITLSKSPPPPPPPPKKCEDRNAINFGKDGACKYPPKPPQPVRIDLRFNADLAKDRLLGYVVSTSPGQNFTIQNGNETRQIDLFVDENHYIDFKALRPSELNEFSLRYDIIQGNKTIKSTSDPNFRVELNSENLIINVTLTKNVIPEVRCDDPNAINFGKVGKCYYAPPPTEIDIRIEGDVVGNDLIGYRLSNGVENRVRNGVSNTRYQYSEGGPNKIEFFRASNIDYTTHSIKYFITNGNRTRELNEFDFSEPLGSENVTIRVVLTKNAPQPPRKQPQLSLSTNSGTYNLSSKSTFTIPFSTTNSDFVRYSFGNVVREERGSSIVLSPSDFNRGVGQYTVNLQPVSNINGSGKTQKFIINVFQTGFIPGPDIRTIDFPRNIQGEDFVGFNVDFDVSYQSVNTNYVDVYVSKVDSSYLIRRNAPGSGKLTFNVNDVLRKSKLGYNQNTNTIDFDLILIPYNTQADELASGRQERINIKFNQGLRIRREDFVRDIRSAFQREFDTSRINNDVTKFLSHQLHLGNGDNKLIANWAIDKQTFDDDSIVLKLYEPLPNNVGVDDKVWISKIQSIPLVDEVRIVDEEVKVCTPLQPNFNIDISDPIGYEIIDSLTASGSLTSTEIIDTYVSSSDFSLTELDLQFVTSSGTNTDYYWEDFVKYSSAKERVENFWYKIRLIESYKSTSGSLVANDSSGSIEVLNEVKRTEQKIKKLEGGFDAFEKYLYESTGSLSYPKTGNLLVSSSTIDAENWYVTASLSANEYDRNNRDALSKNLPKHVQNADTGQEFVLFFDMMGQHFDILWNYVRSVNRAKQLEHKVDTGIANDLIYHMLESLGWDADMGTASQTLWEYAFGKSKTGDDVFESTGQKRQYEIWRRLLNNLPYLLKHKGTKRALHAAMSCYGIPTSMLSIMEFGGPNEPTSGKTKQITFDDRTAALNFNGTSSVDIPWKQYNHSLTNDYPNSIEARISTTQRQDQTLLTNDGNWALKVIHDTGSFARLQFEISSSNNLEIASSSTTFPFYNDEYTQFVVNRSYSGDSEVFDIYAKEGFQGRIRNEESASIILPSGSTSWESGSEIKVGFGFTGSIDDVRLWRVPLNELSINNHTLSPDSIDGNSYSASTDDLLFRNDFEYPKNRSVLGDPYIKNVALINDYASFSTASNFLDITEYPFQYTTYDRQVVANVPSIGLTFGDKFRFEDQELISDLNYRSRATKKSFDQASIDSNQLGLFFSPIKEINMDILKSLGTFNADDYIGNPSDLYKDDYSELKQLRKYYFDRFNLNLNEYIQLVRYIDKTIFTTLESLSPARARVAKGLLIEPHFLERSKTKWEKPSGQIGGIEAQNTVLVPVTSSYINYETSIDVDDISFEFDYDDITVSINAESDIQLNSLVQDYQTIIDTTPDIIVSSSKIDYNVNLDVNREVNLTVEPSNYSANIETEPEITLTSDITNYITNITVSDDAVINSSILTNSGSDMGGISISIDAQILGTIQGEYENDVLTQVGMDPDSQFVNGFGLYGEDGYSIRTFYDKFNNVVKERVKVFKIVEEKTRKVPININRFDGSSYYYDGSSLTEDISTTEQITKVTILPFTGSDGNETNDPVVGGNIINVIPLNGYFPSHFRYVGDRSTGLENSYSKGSKQTSRTTIDGSSAVETFITNPNNLRVTDTGRGSGEPILIVD